MKTNRQFSLAAVCALSLVTLPAAFAAQYDDDFARTDANHDGFIDQTEHIVGTARVFSQADVNKDGYVTPSELSFSPDLKEHDNVRVNAADSEVFRQRDANLDGKVSAAEQIGASSTTFNQLDGNHDGRLSQKEAKSVTRW